MPTKFAANLISESGRRYRRSQTTITQTRTGCLSFAIVAQYGGSAEPGTEACAETIAGETLSLHTVVCPDVPVPPDDETAPVRPLHNHPEGIALAGMCQTVVAIRGHHLAEEQDCDILVDGLDGALTSSIVHALTYAGFDAKISASPSRAKHPENICNRGRRGRGIELDISQDLRERLLDDHKLMDDMACAIRCGLQSVLAEC